MSVWTGTVPEILAGDIVDGDDWLTITSILSALTNSWTDYTPVWTASSVNPAIVNGTITSHYAQAGSLVLYKGAIVAGSGTTFGTGYWIITLPVAASLGNRNTGIITLNDASTSTNDRAGAAEFLSSTTFRVVANGQVAATVPITFATSDAIRWLIVYEAG